MENKDIIEQIMKLLDGLSYREVVNITIDVRELAKTHSKLDIN